MQIIELNIIKIDITGDSILKVIKYSENIILFHKLCYENNEIYISLIIVTIIFHLLSILISIYSMFLYIKKQKKNRFLITTNTVINLLNVYFLHGPVILILCFNFFCHDGDRTIFAQLKEYGKLL